MKKKIDLLEGPIAGTLARLAFPIMGTSFIQMGYNLVDMIWIGRLGSGAVAAVGAAGMFMWMANGVTTIPRIGGQVTVAQKLGSGEKEEAAQYARGALRMGTFLGVLYGILSLLFHKQMIDFFKLNNTEVIQDARIYLMIVCGLVVFSFLDQIIGGILAAMGNTVTTFRVTTMGLLINLILDPVLVFGMGPIPKMGVAGAATATVLAQVIVFVLYLKAIWQEPVIFRNLHLLKPAKKEQIRRIVKIGFPSAIQDSLFSAISMVIARLVAGWGDAAVAVQKVGSQIESISWMMAGGFSTAVNAFIAQNYGAGKKTESKRLQDRFGDYGSLGDFYQLPVDGISGIFLSDFHQRARGYSYGGRLSSDYWNQRIVYVSGRGGYRSVSGTWEDNSAIRDRNYF